MTDGPGLRRARLVAFALRELGLRDDADPAGVDIAGCSGGCIHDVWSVRFERPRTRIDTVVVKMSDDPRDGEAMLASEAHGLARLSATGTLRVPSVFGVVREASGPSVMLVMERLVTRDRDPTTAEWTAFGAALAALHSAHPDGAVGYGDDHDGFLGTTPQDNRRCDDWIEFVATRRLGPMLTALREAELLLGGEAKAIEAVIARLDRLLVARPTPAPLHGDLWNGNVLCTDDGIAVIDPAHFVGDPLAELSIMMLFGGFPAVVFDAHRVAMSERCEDAFRRADTRIGVYRLHHLLNHVLIFGRGYADQALDAATRLLRE